MNTVVSVLDLLGERPATLGEGRLVCIDGPAGSGKTTLAAAVAEGFDKLNRRTDRSTGVPAGCCTWTTCTPAGRGSPGSTSSLTVCSLRWARGGPGSYRRYDWVAREFAETVTVEPVPLLVLEGVGSGAGRFDPLRTVLVWVEAPYDLRMRRGIERDGDTFAPYWEQWAADERELFGRERTRERADLVVDGTRPY